MAIWSLYAHFPRRAPSRRWRPDRTRSKRKYFDPTCHNEVSKTRHDHNQVTNTRCTIYLYFHRALDRTQVCEWYSRQYGLNIHSHRITRAWIPHEKKKITNQVLITEGVETFISIYEYITRLTITGVLAMTESSCREKIRKKNSNMSRHGNEEFEPFTSTLPMAIRIYSAQPINHLVIQYTT